MNRSVSWTQFWENKFHAIFKNKRNLINHGLKIFFKVWLKFNYRFTSRIEWNFRLNVYSFLWPEFSQNGTGAMGYFALFSSLSFHGSLFSFKLKVNGDIYTTKFIFFPPILSLYFFLQLQLLPLVSKKENDMDRQNSAIFLLFLLIFSNMSYEII